MYAHDERKEILLMQVETIDDALAVYFGERGDDAPIPAGSSD